MFVKQDYHTPPGMNCAKTMQVAYIFTALEINILYRNVCVQYIYIYIYIYINTHTHTRTHTHTHTLQFHMSASGTVTHYTGLGFQSPNPPETHCFKWEFCLISVIFSGT